jgi:hypothetical protein
VELNWLGLEVDTKVLDSEEGKADEIDVVELICDCVVSPYRELPVVGASVDEELN